MEDAGVLKDAPAHSIQWPTMSALLVNAEAVAHEVIYGRRMIAAEYLCSHTDMLDPSKLTHAQLPNWLASTGFTAVQPSVSSPVA